MNSDNNPSNQALDFVMYHNGSDNSATCTASSAAFAVANNTWKYVAARYNLTHTAVFIDGAQSDETACSFTNVNETLWTESNTSTLIGAQFLQPHGGTNTQGFFPGYIDEVMIFNRSLSLEQIRALYRNETDTIVAQETSRFENWTIEATPNDGYEDGIMQFNNITILNAKPTHSTPRLNTTNLTLNYTTVNLTAINLSTADIDSDIVKNIYNWIVNGTH